ncbi:hypothetical protein BYT27DRAFT_7188910 [Phlegmacium glaucopus]|nr:hypothetical protein BYT27DRAFT_7188910 [Phlegmacium glaucopus]
MACSKCCQAAISAGSVYGRTVHPGSASADAWSEALLQLHYHGLCLFSSSNLYYQSTSL